VSARKLSVAIPGGASVTLEVQESGGHITQTRWQAVGPLAWLDAVTELRPRVVGAVKDIPVPTGPSPAGLLLKKLILQLKGEWAGDTDDPELCHCRKIPQAVVERAIVLGAHTVEKVRQRTSANTGCGTCLPDVERLLEIYLK